MPLQACMKYVRFMEQTLVKKNGFKQTHWPLTAREFQANIGHEQQEIFKANIGHEQQEIFQANIGH